MINRLQALNGTYEYDKENGPSSTHYVESDNINTTKKEKKPYNKVEVIHTPR